jgi:hypothetical protein
MNELSQNIPGIASPLQFSDPNIFAKWLETQIAWQIFDAKIKSEFVPDFMTVKDATASKIVPVRGASSPTTA